MLAPVMVPETKFHVNFSLAVFYVLLVLDIVTSQVIWFSPVLRFYNVQKKAAIDVQFMFLVSRIDSCRLQKSVKWVDLLFRHWNYSWLRHVQLCWSETVCSFADLRPNSTTLVFSRIVGQQAVHLDILKCVDLLYSFPGVLTSLL